MRIELRPIARLLTLSLLVLACVRPAHASSELLIDSVTLAQLEVRAESAHPRDKCFLYTDLVHRLTEVAGRQIAEGDTEHASITLRRIEEIAQKIHISVASDTKKLKDAEMLLHTTTHRLSDIVRVTASEDREHVMATLQKLDKVHNEILTQVFAH